MLPKKSFSIGEPNQKRFYLECRLLTLAEAIDEEELIEQAEEENPKEEAPAGPEGNDIPIADDVEEIEEQAEQEK